MKKKFLFFLVSVLVGLSTPRGFSQEFRLIDLSEREAGGYIDVFVIGNYACCLSGRTGFDIVNISNPASPAKKGNFEIANHACEVYVESNYAYIANAADGLKIIDITYPSSPSLAGTFKPAAGDPVSIQDVWVSGNHAFLADWYHGLHIVDVSDPKSPTALGSFESPGQGLKVCVYGNYAYLADGFGGLQILTIRDTSSPASEGVYNPSNSYISDVVVKSNRAYIIDADLTAYTYTLKIIDISVPSAPVLLGSCEIPDIARGIYINGNHIYVSCGRWGLQIIDVSRSAAPYVVGEYAGTGEADGVYVKGNFAYVADGVEGLITIDVSNPSSPIPVGFYVPGKSPEISLNRTRLNFGAVEFSGISGPQTFLIGNTGGGRLHWVITDNVKWLNYSSESGTDSDYVTVTADSTGLAAGTHNAVIAVSSERASNSPLLIDVFLKVYKSHQTGAPFGSIATPGDGATVSGCVPVTGWALDDIGVERVDIYYKEESHLIYSGEAFFVEGARPDIEEAYPDYPDNYKAGWGFMLLTNLWPRRGNGIFKIYAFGEDGDENMVLLGTFTINCDNANAVEPFGTLDIPDPGETVSGGNYRSHGWVLTPQPNKVPEDGSTINIFIDGVNVGHPIYNIYRSDIAVQLPGYANSEGSHGYFDFDTTAYENGVHTISWGVLDDAGNAGGVGSRYFIIRNTQNPWRTACRALQADHGALGIEPETLSNIPLDFSSGIEIYKGYNPDTGPQPLYPDENGTIHIEIKELERVEIHLNGCLTRNSQHLKPETVPDGRYAGYLAVGNRLKRLPVGSILDTRRGVFYWQPGPGFVGSFEFVFIENLSQQLKKRNLIIKIVPKF